MKSAIILCLAFCLFGMVFCQAGGQAGAAGAPSMMQRAQLMRALGRGGGAGGGMGGMASLMLMGGMDSNMMEMMLCMRSPIFCMSMMN